MSRLWYETRPCRFPAPPAVGPAPWPPPPRCWAPVRWASSWTQPATPQERSDAEFNQRLAAAAKTHQVQPLLAECERAVHDHPEDLRARMRLAVVHGRVLRRYDACMADLKKADEIIRRTHAPDRSLAKIHFYMAEGDQLQGRDAAAADELEFALKTDRSLPAALNSLAWLCATNPDPALRRGREAVELARQAVQMTGRDNFAYLDTLAAAYAETGDFARAQALEKEAIAAAGKQAGRSKKIAWFAQTDAPSRLDLYTHHQPCHEPPHAPPS